MTPLLLKEQGVVLERLNKILQSDTADYFQTEMHEVELQVI